MSKVNTKKQNNKLSEEEQKQKQLENAYNEKNIEEKYQKMTQLEHILTIPDTYIGSVELTEEQRYILKNGKMELENIKYVPGLYKIYDEIIVNARDHRVRDSTLNLIKVNIDKETGVISIYNNGTGIDVVVHKEYDVYIPELIFGHLLTSTNYDQDEKKTTGGKNGYGAKLANIYSKEFIIETVDSKKHLKYYQKFTNNMRDKEKPKITKTKEISYTKITFLPDYKRFGIEGITDDIYNVFEKRIYDLSVCTPNNVSVYFNDKLISEKSLESYAKLYTKEKPKKISSQSSSPTSISKNQNDLENINEDKNEDNEDANEDKENTNEENEEEDEKFEEQIIVYEKFNNRWEIAITLCPSDGHFQQISFVNGIFTYKGGKHVEYITNQITKKVADFIAKKNKKKQIKHSYIKDNLWVFVNCVIENPSFDSQTKEYLNTVQSKFGSKCEITDKFIDKLSKIGIIERTVSLVDFKENRDLKKTDGKKKMSIRGIPKLDDANYAGTHNAHKCTLILTEGDSAKAFAISGLGVIGRDYYGVFPLKGKLRNVRDVSSRELLKNDEINNLKKIIGLRQGKVYNDTSELRYGSIMILTDADVDGSHIKGLVMNFIHYFWPSLLEIKGFVKSLATPVVKISKGKQMISFYNLSEYHNWKNENNDGKGWYIKYYKGLGTSTSSEAKEYFKDINTSEIKYIIDDEEECKKSIVLAFSKKLSDDRKQWLSTYDKDNVLDQKVKNISFSDFIHKDLIHFSNSDNIRSIPNLCDGLKPSQRKVLYACFKRNLKNEIKVSQLSGYVSEQTAYHHGEMSLHGTIVSLAHDFVGSNNINLLNPNGQFGTRLLGGKDNASARYIFTNLNSLTNLIFHPHDMPILNYHDDDGFKIEPEYYVPIIPIVLINGTEGIGTGFSTNVPCHNPLDICNNLRRMMDGLEIEEMRPWYKGFTGNIIKLAEKFN